MKNNLLHHLSQLLQEINIGETASYATVLSQLQLAGFESSDIQQAFGWLQGFADYVEQQTPGDNVNPSVRIYSPEEKFKLGTKGLNFLLYLENLGIIDSKSREAIIDRLMVLDGQQLQIPQIRWITLMVLANQNPQITKLSWLNSIISYPGKETATCH